MGKRTTRDLIESLRAEAGDEEVLRAGLVVGFRDRSEVVWSGADDPLEELNVHMRDGGTPIGTLTFRRGGVQAAPLPELEGTEWAEKYLFTILGEIVEATGRHVRGEGSDPSQSRPDR